ncbi:hypothetical protein LJC74_10145, partial [Eubacteriales bacterium OttesenSCG-928-A19]|nr:hypothetical protein [Eubacteriales bacterium OttesenSCG-928-A19]
MRHNHPIAKLKQGAVWLLLLCLCFCMPAAMADGVMPTMPAPPTTPVYWQLESIEIEPEITAGAGYVVHDDPIGLSLDLEDGLLTASLLEGDDVAQGVTLYIEKNDELLMEHTYTWTPMPIYLEPGVTYPISITGTQTVDGGKLNTLMRVNLQGETIGRISAGGYTEHPHTFSFEIGDSVGIYQDGSLVVSYVLRDVNSMYTNRVTFTYQ